MLRHRHYNRLCALAARGEVPAAEIEKFTRHLARCSRCRSDYSDFLAINSGLAQDNGASDGDEQIVEALRRPTRNAVMETIAEIKPESCPPVAASQLATRNPALGFHLAWATALGVAIAGSFWFGVRYSSSGPVTVEVHAMAPSAIVPVPPRTSDASINREDQRNQELRADLGKTHRDLISTQERERELEQQITGQRADLTSLQGLLAEKTQQLKQLEDARSSATAVEVALRVQIQDLTDKLNSQTDNLARERELLTRGREIRDIIGARNLHIIDVYDTDTRGRTKHPFARAFYTEGKSLVFYAYDLPIEHGQERRSFVAWGQANGSKSSIKNLGILVNDDQGQRRWSLNFSDPEVLAEIDSVFITLEPNGDAGTPSGKRMLTAYLSDTANHP